MNYGVYSECRDCWCCAQPLQDMFKLNLQYWRHYFINQVGNVKLKIIISTCRLPSLTASQLNRERVLKFGAKGERGHNIFISCKNLSGL